MPKQDKIIKTHVFNFNPYDNGGETVSITTIFFANGDPITSKDGVYTAQSIDLQSYCNSASIHLHGCQITPENLRKLANELEIARNSLVK